MDNVIKGLPSVKFGELNWCYKDGIMYQNDMTPTVEYGKDYFNHYAELEDTEVAVRLNNSRVNFSHKYCNVIFDIGVGSGEFIKKSRAKMYGYDVNPIAIEWLKEQKIWANPYDNMPEDVEGITLWDTLEHIAEPSTLLQLVRSGTFVFISLPIFADLTKVRSSKHYKPGEHLWYFTAEGLINYMNNCGYEFLEMSDQEIKSGRDSILSFAFRKF